LSVQVRNATEIALRELQETDRQTEMRKQSCLS